MSVDITALGPIVKKNLNPILKDELRLKGQGNFFGIRPRSWTGLLAGSGRINFKPGGEYSKELIVESAYANTGKFTDSDEVMGAAATGESDEIKIPWVQYRDVVKMKRIDKAKSQGNQLYKYESMWTKEVVQKLKVGMNNIEDACLRSNVSGAYAKSVHGIPKWISDTGTIGVGSTMVDRAVDTWAKSTIIDNASASKVTIALMRQLRDAHYVNRGVMPQFYACAQNQLTNWQVELEGANRARVQYVTLTIGESEFQALFFDGVPIIAFPGYDTTRIDGINLDLWSIDVLVDMEETEVHDSEEIEHESMIFQLHPLPVSTSHYAAELEMFLQSNCEEPWNQCGLIGLLP